MRPVCWLRGPGRCGQRDDLSRDHVALHGLRQRGHWQGVQEVGLTFQYSVHIHLLIVYFCQDIVFLLKFTLTCLRCGQAAETAEQCESSIDLSLNLVSNYFTFQSWFENCEQLCGFNLGLSIVSNYFIFQSWFEYCQQLFYISILV